MEEIKKKTEEQKNPDNKSIVFGLTTKAWAIIILSFISAVSLVFLIMPYVMSVILPACYPDKADEFGYLAERLNGVSLIVGLAGTIASILSIIMTFFDRKRYSQEKKESKILLDKIEGVRNEVDEVFKYVKETFEQNERLAVCLYEKNVIDKNPNAKWGFSTQNHTDNNSGWQTQSKSNEDKDGV